jgi:hypothetical protein
MKVTQTDGGLASARLGFWAVLLLGVFAWAPATYPGYWQGLEGFAPIFNSTQPNLLAHVATPIDLWRGAGNDAFLLTRPLLLLGVDPTTAVRYSFILFLVLGGLGVYSWLAPRLGDRGAGLAGLLYMLLPAVLATVYVRGSVSDATILALLPMALAGVSIYATHRSLTAALVAVIAIVWMWRAQAGLALLACLLLLFYAWLVERQIGSILIVAVSGLAGGLSLWPVWGVHTPPVSSFDEHFVNVYQLMGWGWQVAPSEPGWQDRYPFQLGIVAVLLAMISVWQWRVHNEPRPRHLTWLLTFCLAVTLMIVGLSLGWAAPLWRWSGAETLLTYPWQATLLAAPLLAALAGSLPMLNREFAAPPLWTALVIVVLLGSYPALTADFTQIDAPAAPLAVVGDQQNLVILSAKLTEHAAPHSAELQAVWQVLHPLAADYNIFLQAQTGDEKNPQVVAQVDTQPLAEGPAATSWRAGQIFTATYHLDLSEQPNATPLRYIFGFYDWRNGQRLPINGGMDDKLILYGN